MVIFMMYASSLGAQTAFMHKAGLDSLVTLARTEKKLIFIDAYTDWCGWCKVMDEKTFPDTAVGRLMSKKFISRQFEMEKEPEGRKLAKKYAITGFPTFMIFDQDMHLVSVFSGYQEPKEFITTLNGIDVAKTGKRPGFSESFDVVYPDIYEWHFSGEPSKREQVTDSMIGVWAGSVKNFRKEEDFITLRKFSSWHELSEKEQGLFFNDIDKLSALFGKDLVQEIADNILMVSYGKTSTMLWEDEEKAVIKVVEKAKKYGSEPEMMELYMLMGYYRHHMDTVPPNFSETGKSYATLYIEAMETYVLKYGTKASGYINYQCWDLYKTATNKEVILKACEWMKTVTDREPTYEYVDTYASLLYKSGQYDKALAQAERAVDIGEKAGSDVGDTKNLLKEIKDRMSPQHGPAKESPAEN